jgi:hypothetical protein
VAGFWADYNYDGVWDKQYNNNVYTGQYQFAFDAAGSSTLAGLVLTHPFGAFCIDVTQYANSGWSIYSLVDLEDAPLTSAAGHMSPQKADDVRELFGRILSSAWNPGHPGQGGYQGGGAKAAEAFAAALWEVVFEKPGLPYDLGSGYFIMNGMDWGADAVAQGWLDRLTHDPAWRDQQVLALVSPDLQDFALSAPGFSGQDDHNGVVPEPLTLLAVGAALAEIAGYARKRAAA